MNTALDDEGGGVGDAARLAGSTAAAVASVGDERRLASLSAVVVVEEGVAEAAAALSVSR